MSDNHLGNISRDVSGLAWKGGPPAYGPGPSGSGCLYVFIMMMLYPIFLTAPMWMLWGIGKLIDLLNWLSS